MVLVALVGALLLAGATTSAPSLRPESLTPLTLRGVGFVPRETVRVVLAPGSGRERVIRTVRAGAAGGFRVRYALVALEPCRGIVAAAATGSRGSRATWKRQCRPAHERPPAARSS